MGRPKLTDLSDYSDYLTAQGIGDNTTKTYCAHVRRVLKSVPALSEANLTEFLYASVSGASRSTVRAAWKHFCGFVRSTLNQVVPDFGTLSPGAVKQVEAAFNPPPAVQVALAAIINISKVSATMLSAATWRSVSITESKGKPVAYLSVREGRVTGAMFPKHLLLPLLAWAAPDTNTPLKSQPLVPSESGGNQPATGLQLRRLAARALDAGKLMSTPETVDDGEECADVFDLNAEMAAYVDEHGQEDLLPPTHAYTQVREFEPVQASTPKREEPEFGINQSRFAVQSAPEDRPMSTAELMAFIAVRGQ